MISAQILADSINPRKVRITTWLLTYPRFIHSEFMTHRVFSRNAASSRAIPFQKQAAAIMENPALPVWWGSAKSGMASGPELVGPALASAQAASYTALAMAHREAQIADRNGLHKSITNRWMEPWAHITVIATATDHRNFFALRAHPAAQPEFQVLAYRMLELYQWNLPVAKKWGEWHLPFTEDTDMSLKDRIRVAVARCCWVSYNKPTQELNENLLASAYNRHDDCLAAGHLSPLEHCAQVCDMVYPASNFDLPFQSNWHQYRKMVPPSRGPVDLDALLRERPEWTLHAGL